MSDRKLSLKERLLAAFGAPGHAASGGGAVALRIYVHGPEEGTDHRVLVGTLTAHAGRWTYRYDPAYAADPAKPPISAFPDKARTYESDQLWAFFDVRLPPLDREDIREIVERERIGEEDKLRLLGSLSRRAVTSPYEFELSHEGA